MRESKSMLVSDDRVWYDQFTSTDWVHDSIADAYRVKGLRSRKDIRGRIKSFFDGTQGWILSALVGFVTATIAYVVDVSETPIFDWKDGYCHDGFFISEKVCRVFSSFSFMIRHTFQISSPQLASWPHVHQELNMVFYWHNLIISILTSDLEMLPRWESMRFLEILVQLCRNSLFQ